MYIHSDSSVMARGQNIVSLIRVHMPQLEGLYFHEHNVRLNKVILASIRS